MKNLRSNLPPLATLLPFEAAARLQSVTRAGEELGLTQAAISRQLRALEDNLGVQLFERRNRGIHLTQEGLAFSRIVSEALGTISHCAQSYRTSCADNELVLFSQLCEGLYWLMPRLSRFYQAHPDIQVRVSVSTESLGQHGSEFDLALQTTQRDCGHARRIFSTSDEVFPICSPAYLNGTGRLPLVELKKHHLLHFQSAQPDWMGWDQWLAALGCPQRIGLQGTIYDSFPMMIQAVLEGHGIALGWRQTSERLLATGELVQPCAETVMLPDGLSLYEPHDRVRRSGTDELACWIAAEFETEVPAGT